MTAAPSSLGGRQLWGLLPEHYRARDNGDLAGYVDALGEVLDLLRGVIEQRLSDSFPDDPDLQPWVLPYLADLIDTRLVSADEARRRLEIENAALWRRTKGTLGMVEDIARALGGFGWTDGTPAERPREPVLVQEGFRRVVVTPRVPLSAPAELAADRRRLLADASLPMGTVDFRAYSRRVAASDGSAWRQANPHGIPCFPNSVEDLSARTPDLRALTPRGGFAHPNRVLVFNVPHAGYFPPGWDFGLAPSEDETSLRGGVLVVDTLEIEVPAGQIYTLEDCIIDGEVRVTGGPVRLVRCAVRSLRVDAPQLGDASAGAPLLSATDSLLESAQAAGLAELTFCTVLQSFQAPRVWTSDSLFAGAFAVPKPAEPWHRNAQGEFEEVPENALRYSRVPAGALAPELVGTGQKRLDFRPYRCTSALPFFAASEFGVAGSGVLMPLAGPAIQAGAEDGGELGAYHHRGHAIHVRAVLDKLRDYLPVGQVAAVLPDAKLYYPPPTVKNGP